MAMLFSFDDILITLDGVGANLRGAGISCVVIDSRDVPENALFVAIKGDRFDGHDFAKAAIENGAAAALVRRDFSSDGPLPLIGVADPLAAMADLGRAARQRSSAQIAGVTGSVGKTTTKEALRHILSAKDICHASIKSYNNHWGVPLMLSNLPENAAFGVFEMGMNHAGEISPLTKMVRPHLALITSIAAAHIGELGSMAAIAAAKAEIFEGLEAGGTAIINADHDFVDLLTAAARSAGARQIVTYGFTSREADAQVPHILIDGFQSDGRTCSASIVVNHAPISLNLSVPGRHMMNNAVGAALAAQVMGVDWPTICKQLRSFEAPDGRGAEFVVSDGQSTITLIDESYNANPASMRAALDVFATKSSQGRRVLVLGEMRELGENSTILHKAMEQIVGAAKPDMVFLVGAEMQPLRAALSAQSGAVVWAESVGQLSAQIVDFLDQGDLIMLKGSNGVGLGQVVTQIRHRFGQHLSRENF